MATRLGGFVLGLVLFASPAVAAQLYNVWGPMCPDGSGWVRHWQDDHWRDRWTWTITRPDGKEIAMYQAGNPWLPERCWNQAYKRFICFVDRCHGIGVGQSCPSYPYDGCGKYELG